MRPLHRIGLAVLASALVLSACATAPIANRPTSEDEGTLLVYLQPFPPEAGRIRFTLERLSAVREDGTETILPLALTELRGADLKRQRVQVEAEITFVIESHRRLLEAGREATREPDRQDEKLKILKSSK